MVNDAEGGLEVEVEKPNHRPARKKLTFFSLLLLLLSLSLSSSSRESQRALFLLLFFLSLCVSV